jgi:DNA-binding MarR family transcriptional regulator
MTSAADLFNQFVRVETKLYNRADARIRTTLGASLGQLQLLDIITRTEHCRVDDIAQVIDVGAGTVSKSVDRLEAAGWCVRAPNPTDRRSSWLAITEAGRDVLRRGWPLLDATAAEFFDDVVSKAERAQLAVAMGRLHAALFPANQEHHRV